MEWLKADFHLHSNDCIFDGIPHSACQLIDRAAELGFRALALTNHNFVMFSNCWRDYALERGIILFSGIEAEIKRRHVLIINATADADRLRSFADLEAYRRSQDCVIIAPHPFYPGLICLRRKLYRYRHLFDAVEYNSFYTSFFNPNEAAVNFARENDLPLIGGSDTHRLSMLGNTYSLLKADFNEDSILNAVRQGQIKIVTQPFTGWEAFSLAARLRCSTLRMDIRRLIFPAKLRCPYHPWLPDTALPQLSPAAGLTH